MARWITEWASEWAHALSSTGYSGSRARSLQYRQLVMKCHDNVLCVHSWFDTLLLRAVMSMNNYQNVATFTLHEMQISYGLLKMCFLSSCFPYWADITWIRIIFCRNAVTCTFHFNRETLWLDFFVKLHKRVNLRTVWRCECSSAEVIESSSDLRLIWRSGITIWLANNFM